MNANDSPLENWVPHHHRQRMNGNRRKREYKMRVERSNIERGFAFVCFSLLWILHLVLLLLVYNDHKEKIIFCRWCCWSYVEWVIKDSKQHYSFRLLFSISIQSRKEEKIFDFFLYSHAWACLMLFKFKFEYCQVYI